MISNPNFRGFMACLVVGWSMLSAVAWKANAEELDPAGIAFL